MFLDNCVWHMQHHGGGLYEEFLCYFIIRIGEKAQPCSSFSRENRCLLLLHKENIAINSDIVPFEMLLACFCQKVFDNSGLTNLNIHYNISFVNGHVDEISRPKIETIKHIEVACEHKRYFSLL